MPKGFHDPDKRKEREDCWDGLGWETCLLGVVVPQLNEFLTDPTLDEIRHVLYRNRPDLLPAD